MSALETISQHCKTLRLPTIAEAVPEALSLAQQLALTPPIVQFGRR